MILAGIPPAIQNGGMLFETTELAPIILPLPIVTPGSMDTNSPIHTLSSIIIGEETNGLSLGSNSGEECAKSLCPSK